MGFGRKFLLVLMTPLFTLLLFVTAIDFGIIRFGGSPAPVKKLLSDSGIYKNVIPHALDNVKSSSSDSGSVSLSDPIVKNAAAKALSPQVIQQSTNQIIDGFYHWLDGKTSLPDFNVDLSGAKANFATLVGQAAQQRAASLPVCTSFTSTSSFDPLSATCLPPGTSAAQAGAVARDTLLTGKGFLENPVINASALKASNSNQSVFADKQNIPKQFQRAKKTPLILIVLTVLVGTAIVFLSASRQKGLRRIGWMLLGVGFFMLIFAWALNFAVNDKVLPKLNINNAALSGDIKTLIRDVMQAVDKNYWWFGIGYTFLGAATLGGPSLYRRFDSRRATPKPKVSAQPESQDHINKATADKTPATEQKPPVKKSVKVQ